MIRLFALIIGAFALSTPVSAVDADYVTCTVSPSMWSQLAGDVFVSNTGELNPQMLDIFEKAGIRPKLIPLLPEKRIAALHKQGQIDIVMTTLIFIPTEMVPSIPILNIGASIAVKAELEKPPQLVAVSDIMVQFSHTILDAVKEDYTTVIIPERRALRMLRDDEVEAIIVGNLLFWNKPTVDLGGLALKVVEQPNMPKFPLYFTFSKSSACTRALKAFNVNMQAALDAGLRDDIHRALQANTEQAIKTMLD
ncbi:type 2 periplasmic-binding domain-containing protein [Kordiimonas pumila]|uniref:Solute-binding protein family 3/N-terminal domain-containing protein n=1 Tax=Kordiimonas pumila TaxID=2161677 RepID=A0ABV7D0M0_9PROT|nr:hypothetical protein [Kordiimonas pumila]